ncbi:MAG: hypothetical protein NUV69_04775 [Candidatus Curtissbacteria bacterium]|nr:hypothetical protein [Candidatus Curtissbacteria bacterium]
MITEEQKAAYIKRDRELAEKFGTVPDVISAIKGMVGQGRKPKEIQEHFEEKARNLLKHKDHNRSRLEHAKFVVSFLSRISEEDLKEINKPVKEVKNDI